MTTSTHSTEQVSQPPTIQADAMAINSTRTLAQRAWFVRAVILASLLLSCLSVGALLVAMPPATLLLVWGLAVFAGIMALGAAQA